MVASIKESPEDFVVEEIPLGLEPSEAGRYWVLKVRLRSWDTNAFLIELADRLRISRKRITYAGTKDKHGITTQYFCINAPVDPGSIRIRDAEILEWFRTDRMLRLGDLVGNRFRVRISSASDLRGGHVEETVREMLSKGGDSQTSLASRGSAPSGPIHTLWESSWSPGGTTKGLPGGTSTTLSLTRMSSVSPSGRLATW